MTFIAPSEKRIQEYMSERGQGNGYTASATEGGPAPYRVEFWEEYRAGRKTMTLFGWIENYPEVSASQTLSQIPNMAHAIFDEALEYNEHWEKTHGKLNNQMTPSEEKIHEHMVESQGYGGNPYRNNQWTDAYRETFLTWAENPFEHSDKLSFLPNMAQMIVAEAYEYAVLFDAGEWNPKTGRNKPVDENGESFQELLRQHQELATLRARLKKMDDHAVQEQRRITNRLRRESAARFYEANTAEELLKIHDYEERGSR